MFRSKHEYRISARFSTVFHPQRVERKEHVNYIWVVVSKYGLFSPQKLGKLPILTHIFQRG